MSITLAAALPLPVVAPLAGSVLSPLAARVHRRLPLVIGILATGTSVALMIAVAARVFSGHGQTVTHFFSNEQPVAGHALGIAFTADPFGVTYGLLCAALGLLLLVAALSELGGLGRTELGGLACLTQLLIAGLIGSALTADLVNLFVWFEVAALASYGLTGFFLERPVALEAALKIAVLTSIGGFAIFTAAAMLYARRGALNLGQLHDALHAGRPAVGGPEAVALALLVLGFGTKAGLAPFHGWLPDAHTPVPGAVSALFSGLMVNLGVVALARITLQVFGPDQGRGVLGLLTALGLVSALGGAALALVQDDLKRLLAWDTVSQMGVLIVGFASATEAGVAGATYHLVNHALFKALLFLCAGTVVHATGETSLTRMGGLARSRPVLTAGFTVGALAIAGVPPLNGFVSLGLIHDGVQRHPFVHAVALLAQVVTVAALGRAAYLGFWRRREEPYEHLERTPRGMFACLVTLIAGCVAFGVLPGVIARRMAGPGASVLLHPEQYAAAALGTAQHLPAVHLSTVYGNSTAWITTLSEIVIGLGLAAAVLRAGPVRQLEWLRRLHTGSVNDYAAFSAIGLILSALILLR